MVATISRGHALNVYFLTKGLVHKGIAVDTLFPQMLPVNRKRSPFGSSTSYLIGIEKRICLSKV